MKMKRIEQFAKSIKAANPSVLAQPSPKKQNTRKRTYAILLGILIIGLIAVSSYYYWQFKQAKEDTTEASQKEIQNLVAEVSKIFVLPDGIDPTVATVSNKDQLQDQDFFKNAENGDKILIYASTKMAILYRPSAKKIIKVAPLVLDQTETNSSPLTNTSGLQGATNTDQSAP